MPTSVREVFKQELERATSAKSFDQTWSHLERAHIVSQAWAWPHTQTHWLMLLQAFRSRDGREKCGGTLACMGAYDVHQARLIGSVAEKTGIVPFMELVDRVMTQQPYVNARTVYWIVDNGSSHHGQRSVDRMAVAWPNDRLVHLPIHASWLNQIEIVFSIIQRKVIKPADFADLDALADRLRRFEDRYNQTAGPFELRFTTDDLTTMLQRVYTPNTAVLAA
jgi:Protein of unknown function (DUF3703)/DDE superfamily endonuclease